LSFISSSSLIFFRPKVKQRKSRDIIGLRRFASKVPYIADQIGYDLARRRAAVGC
jgi:hypothetical protein